MFIYTAKVLAVLSVALGTLAYQTNNFSSFTYEAHRRILVEKTPTQLSDWELQNSDGETIKLSDLSEKTLLVDFVFTRCPTICRTLGSRYEQLQSELESLSENQFLLLSISIDPVFDTPEQLEGYHKRHLGKKEFWQVARPANDDTLQTIISETGLRVISDSFGGLAHSDAIHLIEKEKLTKIKPWDSSDWESIIIADDLDLDDKNS